MVRLALLKQKDERTIRELYNEQRPGFLRFLKSHFNLSEEDAVDIFQDSVVALIENIQKGKLDHYEHALSTYLFAIGKYKAIRMRKEQIKMMPIDFRDADIELADTDDADQTLQEKIISRLSHLGERCRDILRLFYYEGKKTDEIMKLMGYENKNVFKSQKSRCLSQLKTMLNERNRFDR